jgi:hypothetical protein
MFEGLLDGLHPLLLLISLGIVRSADVELIRLRIDHRNLLACLDYIISKKILNLCGTGHDLIIFLF